LAMRAVEGFHRAAIVQKIRGARRLRAIEANSYGNAPARVP
jgi:hypothetical protein